mgnify:CR=1 FL=1
MIRHMLDADVCIHLLRRSPPRDLQRRFIVEASGLGLSAVVLTELLVGARKNAHPAEAESRLEKFCAPLVVVDFDSGAANHAADIRCDLERRGQKIGPLDTLIAGHARSLGAIIVTGNLREFSRVAGLRCEDWFSSVQGFSE